MKQYLALAALAFALFVATASGASAQNAVCPTMPPADSSNACASTAFVKGAVSTPTLLQGYIFVGNSSNLATGVLPSGDCGITVAGVITCLTLNSVAPGALYPLGAGTGLSVGGGNLNISAVAWSQLTGTPTTLSGYGITSPLPVNQGGTAAATASGTALDNITGFASTGIMSRTGAGAYAFSTLTALLDSGLCSTQGSVTYRNASQWVCLTPGSSGQVLTSAGAAANPTWQTITGTGTVTSVGTSGCASGGAITTTGTVAVTPATNSNIWGAAANDCVDAAGAAGALSLTALTDAATIALDMSTFVNATVTIGGNRTLGNPSNTQAGRCGMIYIVQDGTGSRTLAYSANWKFQGGTAPTLSTAAGAVDALSYCVRTSTFIVGSLGKAFN